MSMYGRGISIRKREIDSADIVSVEASKKSF